MIKDDRGKVPNFVFDQVKMVHQPTGLEIKLISGSEASLRLAHNALKVMVRDHYRGSTDALDGAAGTTTHATQPEGS